jgi:hypothetical protein
MAPIACRETGQSGTVLHVRASQEVNLCKPHHPGDGVITEKSGGGYSEVMPRPNGYGGRRARKGTRVTKTG